MNGIKISESEIEKIKKLRETGHSLPEIMKQVRRGSSTVHKYIKDVAVLPKYRELLKQKRGGNTYRASLRWQEAERNVESMVKILSKTEKLLIASCLYWGEGTKKELSLTNSDPLLIKAFTSCLEDFGVSKTDLRVTIRIYEDLAREKCIQYWADVLNIPKGNILNVNVLSGKKIGKLPFGMCRVRVTKGQKTFKLLQSTIKVISRRLGSFASP